MSVLVLVRMVSVVLFALVAYLLLLLLQDNVIVVSVPSVSSPCRYSAHVSGQLSCFQKL